MKHFNWKRIGSLFLTAAMCLGMVPAVFAAADTKAAAAGSNTIDLLFICGQSNAAGWIDDGTINESMAQGRSRAVACDSGHIFSTVIPLADWQNDVDANYTTGITMTAATEDNVSDYISESVGSNTSLSGNTLAYKPNALSTNGTGKSGMDGAIAYEWNRLTGNDVWVCNSAANGVAMDTWVPGATQNYYGITLEAMQGMIDVVNNDSNYELGNIVMFWQQGESDTTTAQSAYYSEFTNMIESFKADISGLNVGIVLPRGMNNEHDYDVVFADNGAKEALYQAANSYDYVCMASDINKYWVDDSAVALYFTGKYGTGNVPYPIHSGGRLAVPTTYDETFTDPHYHQAAHNENGLTAAEGMYCYMYYNTEEHSFGEPEFVWADDYSSCAAVFTCGYCGYIEVVECEISVSEENPGCTTDGATIYTAIVEFNGQTYTDTKSVAIPATGHKFSGNVANLVWTWSSDHMSATASYVCENCGETVTVNATVTVSEDPSTCTEDGRVVYSATVTIDGKFYYNTYDEPIKATGHNLSATFDWASDGSSCTAHIVCSRGDLDTYENCVIAEISRTDATCTQDGTVTKQASIDYLGQSFTSIPETFAGEKALGHEYGEPVFAWLGNNTTCTATFTCVRGDDSFTLNCAVSTSEQAPTCTETGMRTYVASVDYDGNTYTDSREETIAATGHDYVRETIRTATCGTDGYTENVCRVCGDPDESSIEMIPATGNHTFGDWYYTIYPTCLNAGEQKRECTVCHKATETKTVPALGHQYEGEITWSDDHKTASITITCGRENDYYAVYSCNVTYEVVVEAGCETVGTTEYTAVYDGPEGYFDEAVTIKDISATDHKYTYDLKSFIFADGNGNTWQYGEDDSAFEWNDNVTCVCIFTCSVCGKQYIANCDVHTVSGYTQEMRYATDFIVYVGDTRLLSVRTMDGHVVSVDFSPQTLSGAEIGDTSAEEANEELGTVVSIETTDNLDKGLTIEEAEIAGEAAGAGENGNNGIAANGTADTEGAKTGDNAIWCIAGLFATGIVGIAEILNWNIKKRKSN